MKIVVVWIASCLFVYLSYMYLVAKGIKKKQAYNAKEQRAKGKMQRRKKRGGDQIDGRRSNRGRGRRDNS